MTSKLEDRCAICPELLADGYGKCDHRRCLACLRARAYMETICLPDNYGSARDIHFVRGEWVI